MSEYVASEPHNITKLRTLHKFMRGHKGFIAGGCFKNILTDTKLKDVDIFFESESDWADAERVFKEDESYKLHYENTKVTAYKHTDTGIIVELVRSTFGTPEQIISKFDFTIVKFAYFKTIDDAENVSYNVIHHNQFFEHLFFKRIVIGKELGFPESTFERVLRYAKYGYAPCRESKINLIIALRTKQGDVNISESMYDGMD